LTLAKRNNLKGDIASLLKLDSGKIQIPVDVTVTNTINDKQVQEIVTSDHDYIYKADNPPSRFISEEVWSNHLRGNCNEEPDLKYPTPQDVPHEPEQLIEDSILLDNDHDKYENNRKQTISEDEYFHLDENPTKPNYNYNFEPKCDNLINKQPEFSAMLHSDSRRSPYDCDAVAKQMDAIQNQQHVFSTVILLFN
jgi:hypothetical protein